MKCTKCQALLPSHYNKCPVCNYNKLATEKFKRQEQEQEDVEYAPVSPYVVSSTFDDMDGGE